MTLPSVSLAAAISLPPPTSLIGCSVFCAGFEERAEARADVVDVPVTDGAGYALAVAVGVETDMLAFDVESDGVHLVH
jgi:hypothetical protein